MSKLIKIEPNQYKLRHVYICSGDDEYPGCTLSIATPRWYITIRLPQLIKPHREWVDCSGRAWSTSQNKGFWDIHRQQYGVSLHENHLSFQYGAQTNDSSTSKRKGFFFPWGEWRFVRFSLYDLAGNHFWTQMEKERRCHKRAFPESSPYEQQREAEARMPKVIFIFADYDGEVIEATTHIEEREWLRGDKWCEWLSWFYKPMIRRSLDITFSKETGQRKGSWKGGTLGHGIEMLPGELHEPAFERYCAKHSMIFLGAKSEPVATILDGESENDQAKQ